MKIKSLFLIGCLSLFSLVTLAQEKNYNASAENPYGLPNPKAPQQVKDYAPMIGKCNCKSTKRNPDQSWAEPVDMVWTFKYILNGTAVQDESFKSDGSHSGSIRQYRSDSAKWYVHWFSSTSPSTSLPTWEGNLNAEKDRMVLYRDQKAPNGMEGFSRLTFHNFSDQGFSWMSEWVDKSENFVFPTWKIECKRADKP